MASTVTDTRPLTKKGIGGGPKNGGPQGNGAPKRDGDSGFRDLQSSANRYRLGMWVALASILMMFTALSSAYIVRAASSTDWVPLNMPRILWLSTALILISSGTLETARHSWKNEAGDRNRIWLLATAA